MSALDFSVIEREDTKIWVRERASNDKSQARDIPALSKEYYAIVGKNEREVLPFFILSRGYDTATGDFRLAIGGLIENAGLLPYTISKGRYGRVTVRPKLGFIWGAAIGEAKRAFYTKWLPQSDYIALNMEYELHTEASVGKKPQIDILFAIRPKDD